MEDKITEIIEKVLKNGFCTLPLNEKFKRKTKRRLRRSLRVSSVSIAFTTVTN